MPLTTALHSSSIRPARQERHLNFVAQFTHDIRYIRGSENVAADTLSRPDVDSVDFITKNLVRLAQAQKTDEELVSLINNPPQNSGFKLELIKVPACSIDIWCEVSKKNCPFIPKDFRQEVYDSIHMISHPSVRTTRKKITRLYFWPNMNTHINAWANSCVQCQKQKVNRHVKTPIQNIEIPKGRFQHIHVDIVGPLPQSNGNRYILTVVDRYSRWPEAYPIPNIEAKTIACTLVNEYISRFGIPIRITTDQGAQFESRLFSELCKMLGISHIHTTPYHPCANGMVERFHRQLKVNI